MNTFDEEQASASVPVAAVIVYPQTLQLRERMILRAYHTRAKTGLQPTQSANLTVKSFNERYGKACKKWADVLTESASLLRDGE